MPADHETSQKEHRLNRVYSSNRAAWYSGRNRPYIRAALLALVGLLGLGESARGNLPAIDLGDTNNVTVLRTGGINPLITRYWDLPLNDFPYAPWLSFSFAFATDEIPREAEVFDAASFFIQDLNQFKVTVLATVDGNGVVWLPPTEGTVVIPADDQTHETMDFPSLQPVMLVRTSHFVTIRIPQVYYPEPIRFVFQMFDYPNGINSVGVVTPPQLYLVPEPTMPLLGLLGLLAFWCRSRTSKSRIHANPKT